jgi:Xaa-Pro aminopeptidase
MPTKPNNRAAQRAALAESLRDNGLRVVALNSYQAVSYFAGTNILTQVSLPDRMAFCLCFDDGSAAMIVCDIEASMVRTQTDIPQILEFVEFVDDPTETLAKALIDRGVTNGRIGVQSRRMPARSADILTRALPDVEIVEIDDPVEEAQTVKSGDEIGMLQAAAQRTLDSVLAGAAATGPGHTEQELCARIGSRMYTAGGMPVFTFFGTGERALGAHVEPIDRRLVEGELWRIDLGGRFYELMNSDLARTGVVGEPDDEQESILQDLLACQAAGFAALEPGRPASDVFHAVAAEFERRGMTFAMPHVGHGIGIGLHEFPILHPGNHAPLRAGMVLNVEPMFKSAARRECYHVEDLAVVTDDGFRLLTQPQSSLLRIEA